MPDESELLLRKAHASLRAARELLEADLPSDAVSRAYYAAFHAATALLVRRGIHVRTHRGTLHALRDLAVAGSGLLPSHLEAFQSLLEARIDGDYDALSSIGVGEAERLVGEAEALVEALGSL